jgi:hypothetical protein
VLWSEAEIIGKRDIQYALLKRRQTDAAAETILHQPIEGGFDLQAVISQAATHPGQRPAHGESGDLRMAMIALGVARQSVL